MSYASLLAAVFLFTPALPAVLVPLSNQEGQAAFAAGRYEDIVAIPPREKRGNAEWAVLNLRALRALGRYKEARDAALAVYRSFPRDAEVQMEAYRALEQAGNQGEATKCLMLAAGPAVGAESVASAAARAEAQIIMGADPKTILNDILEPLQEQHPEERATYLVIGRLGLAKHDYKLAADSYKAGLKRFPDDGEMNAGLAQAFKDPMVALPLLEAAIKKNPRDGRALVLQGEMLWDSGDPKKAVDSLNQALAVNPADPEALARLAALALLDGDKAKAEKLRKQALSVGEENPRVDFVIGSMLVHRYRFEEGIRYLKSAVAMDPGDFNARFELGSNLLRYGSEDKGWKEIEAVYQRDPYNVAAFNLITLRDQLAKYEFSEKDGVRLRMHPTDLKMYGPQALDLAAKAKSTLTEKYGVSSSTPLTVEIFGQQQDFAARTFSMPVGEGFLGVCFGPLVTSVSPRGLVEKMNWQAVVWHEVAHTVTLALSNHRIPRWLTEGISVYEEKQENPSWGRPMSGRYRKIIEKGEPPLTISGLDALFTSNMELAYFESSLAVEFLVEKYGFPALRQVLVDLGADVPLDQALAKRMAPLDQLNPAFNQYALQRAKAYGPSIDWADFSGEEYVAFTKDPDAWVAAHPRRYEAVVRRAGLLASEGAWDRVVPLLDGILALEPNNHEEANPYLMLAAAHRHLGNLAAERQALEKFVALEDAPEPALLRLIEIAQLQDDPALASRSANAIMAIDPFQSAALRVLARAMVADHRYREAAVVFQNILTLDPADSAAIKLELVRALRSAGDPAYRHALLDLLAENPRNREALSLLAHGANANEEPTR